LGKSEKFDKFLLYLFARPLSAKCGLSDFKDVEPHTLDMSGVSITFVEVVETKKEGE
jgi:hypothetical protein